MEQATAAGVHVNATVHVNASVCFTVPQAVAVAEAVERGLSSLGASGGDVEAMTPVCTIMVGRLDDWVRTIAERDAVAIDPNALDWAGIAVFKQAVSIYRERGYRTRLLAAAYRHRLHWTELVGGNIVMTMTHAWQTRFETSGLDPVSRIDVPADPRLVAELGLRIPDFSRAYQPNGMSIDEFDGYGATVRTLLGFIASYHDLLGAVRDIVLPNPDVRPG